MIGPACSACNSTWETGGLPTSGEDVACCYRHRYLAILRQRSVSTDRQCSMSTTVTRTILADA
jgi:hypothetical protein